MELAGGSRPEPMADSPCLARMPGSALSGRILLRDDLIVSQVLIVSKVGQFTHRNPVGQESPTSTSGLVNALLAHGKTTERHDRDIIVLISPVGMSSNI